MGTSSICKCLGCKDPLAPPKKKENATIEEIKLEEMIEKTPDNTPQHKPFSRDDTPLSSSSAKMRHSFNPGEDKSSLPPSPCANCTKFNMKTSPLRRQRSNWAKYSEFCQFKTSEYTTFRLASGGFSDVTLMSSKENPSIKFVLKQMKIGDLEEKKIVHCISLEKEILKNSDSQFIVYSPYAYETKDSYCIVMEYCEGGDMQTFLQETGPLSEEEAVFYVAETIIGIDYLHSNQIMWRDLKPSNILLDSKGHVKLTDFGLSTKIKESENKVHTVVGSYDYMAPEIFEKEGYTKDCDWFSFGVFCFFLLTGTTPYKGRNNNYSKFYTNCVNKLEELQISKGGIHFITHLLAEDPSQRLGHKGCFELMSHEWLAGIDWTQAAKRKLLPPDLSEKKDRKKTLEQNDIIRHCTYVQIPFLTSGNCTNVN